MRLEPPRHKADFLPAFEGWNFDWLDCPGFIRTSVLVHEYPMVDREPLPSLTTGCVTLMGDAAHANYPMGSNGASQAIIDALKLGAVFRDHGIPRADLAVLAQHYRRLSGFSIGVLNAQPPILGPFERARARPCLPNSECKSAHL